MKTKLILAVIFAILSTIDLTAQRRQGDDNNKNFMVVEDYPKVIKKKQDTTPKPLTNRFNNQRQRFNQHNPGNRFYNNGRIRIGWNNRRLNQFNHFNRFNNPWVYRPWGVTNFYSPEERIILQELRQERLDEWYEKVRAKMLYKYLNKKNKRNKRRLTKWNILTGRDANDLKS